MFKKVKISLIILILLVVISVSGCTSKNATNGTFGEKSVSIKNVTIVNSTYEDYEYPGTKYYIIRGYLKNNNKYDAYNLKMQATTYDADGNVVSVNDTVYLSPKVLPADGLASYDFYIPNKDGRIVRYDLQLISITVQP